MFYFKIKICLIYKLLKEHESFFVSNSCALRYRLNKLSALMWRYDNFMPIWRVLLSM